MEGKENEDGRWFLGEELLWGFLSQPSQDGEGESAAS